MTVHIHFDFLFLDGIAETSAVSAFSSNFCLFVSTSFCFSLTALSFLFAFARFNLAVSTIRHVTFAPCESTLEPEDRAACNLLVPHDSSSSAVCISSIASCSFLPSLSPLTLNDLVSFLSSPGLFSFVLPLQLSISLPPPSSSRFLCRMRRKPSS